MKVRRKFKCDRIERCADGYDEEGKPVVEGTVEFSTVIECGGEDSEFPRCRPGGHLEIRMPDTEQTQFQPGRSYFVDITPADTED